MVLLVALYAGFCVASVEGEWHEFNCSKDLKFY